MNDAIDADKIALRAVIEQVIEMSQDKLSALGFADDPAGVIKDLVAVGRADRFFDYQHPKDLKERCKSFAEVAECTYVDAHDFRILTCLSVGKSYQVLHAGRKYNLTLFPDKADYDTFVIGTNALNAEGNVLPFEIVQDVWYRKKPIFAVVKPWPHH